MSARSAVNSMKILLALAFAVTAGAQAPAKVDLTGKWLFSVTTDGGTGTPTVTLKQQGDSLSGTYSSQIFGEQAIKGTVTGSKIGFTFTATVQGQTLTVSYAGTIEPDGSLKGTVDLGGFGSGTFTAKKQT